MEKELEGVKYMKKSKFASVLRGSEDYIIHSSLYGGVIKAKCSGAKAFFDMIESRETFEIDENEEMHQKMKEMRLIVEDSVDESNLVNYYFWESQQYELMVLPIVTRHCNFRCTYCYEDFQDKKMEPEIYDILLSEIERLIELKGYKVVRISFFGGEPLLEYEAIIHFSEKMNDVAASKNITYIGGMSTNGFLLTEEKLKKLTSLNVKNYQITVDGLEDTHDRLRPQLGGQGSWQEIMQNLCDAQRSGLDFHISIRTNFDENIEERAEEYLDYMTKYFKEDKRFCFQFEAAKRLGERGDDDLNEVNDEASVISKMYQIASRKGLNISASIGAYISPFGMVCYAAKNDSFVLDCDGTVMKCTVHLDEAVNKIGNFSEGKIKIHDFLISYWTSRDIAAECKECKILPICYDKKCPIVPHSNKPCRKLISIYENSLRALYLA